MVLSPLAGLLHFFLNEDFSIFLLELTLFDRVVEDLDAKTCSLCQPFVIFFTFGSRGLGFSSPSLSFHSLLIYFPFLDSDTVCISACMILLPVVLHHDDETVHLVTSLFLFLWIHGVIPFLSSSKHCTVPSGLVPRSQSHTCIGIKAI